MWAQKSKVNWLKWGDKNSKFFHLSTMIRRTRNQIVSLKNPNGDWVKGQVNLQSTVKDYFSSLFDSTLPSGKQIASITENAYLFMSKDFTAFLDRDFTPEEIKKVIF